MPQTDAEIIGAYFLSIVIVAITIILAWIVNGMIKWYIRKREGKKKSKTIDIVLNNLRPLYLLIIIIGIYFAFELLPFVAADTFKNFNAWIETSFFILLIFLLCYVLARIVKIFVDRYFVVRREDTRSPGIIMKMIMPVIFLVGVLVILGTYNVDIVPLLTTFGIGGIALGFALQPTLTNLFAGLSIISSHLITVGDYIEVEGGVAGYVYDIGWFSTHIRTLFNLLIAIPNSKLTASVITNYTLVKPKYCQISVAVDYNQDLERIEQIVKKVAAEVTSIIPGGDTSRDPVVRFDNLDTFNVVFRVILYLEKLEAQYQLKSEVIKAIKKKFDEEGINMPRRYQVNLDSQSKVK